MTLTDLKQERADLLDQNDDLFRKAEKAGRDLNIAEQKQVEQNLKEVDQLDERIEAKKEMLIREAQDGNGFQNPKNFSIGGHAGSNNRKGVEIWETASGPTKGQQIRVLNQNRSLFQDLKYQHPSDFRNFENYSWADYIRGRINGESRLMDTSNDSQLVPTPLSAQVIDKARNMSRVFQAGARLVPMTSKTLDIARVTDDVSAEWKAEGSAFTQSDVSLDKVTFTAKTLIAGTKLTVELAEDSPNANEVIQNSIAEKLAMELDRVALVGSGSGQEPEGLSTNANVQEVSMGTDGATITDYTQLSQAYQKVLEKNGIPRSAIFAPRTWGEIDRLTDLDGNPLRSPQSWAELQKLVTNQVPIDQTQGTSTDASTLFMGDFSQLLVGMRTQLRIEVTRSASDANGSAWENLEIWIRGYMRADIQFAHPDHFCRVVGLNPEA